MFYISIDIYVLINMDIKEALLLYIEGCSNLYVNDI